MDDKVKMRVEGFLEINYFRNIVDTNMPFDTGFMMMNGTSYTVQDDYHRVKYDTQTVPYIVYNEEGTKFFDQNKGFIKEDTLIDLAEASAYQDMGMTHEKRSYQDAARARASMISNGVYENISGYGRQGGNYGAFRR